MARHYGDMNFEGTRIALVQYMEVTSPSDEMNSTFGCFCVTWPPCDKVQRTITKDAPTEDMVKLGGATGFGNYSPCWILNILLELVFIYMLLLLNGRRLIIKLMSVDDTKNSRREHAGLRWRMDKRCNKLLDFS